MNSLSFYSNHQICLHVEVPVYAISIENDNMPALKDLLMICQHLCFLPLLFFMSSITIYTYIGIIILVQYYSCKHVAGVGLYVVG